MQIFWKNSQLLKRFIMYLSRCQIKKKQIYLLPNNEECGFTDIEKIVFHQIFVKYVDLGKSTLIQRDLYRRQANENIQKDSYFSADLEKIIMLPRLDTFKKVVFTKRHNEELCVPRKEMQFPPSGGTAIKKTAMISQISRVQLRKQIQLSQM